MGDIEIIPLLYQLVAIISAIGYLPQIYNLIISTGKSLAISLTTWFIWLSSWLISLTYGILYIEDWRFILVASINVLGHVLIIGLTIYNRFYRFKDKVLD